MANFAHQPGGDLRTSPAGLAITSHRGKNSIEGENSSNGRKNALSISSPKKRPMLFLSGFPRGIKLKGEEINFDDKCLLVTNSPRRIKVACKAVISPGGKQWPNLDNLTCSSFPPTEFFPRGKKVPKIRQFFPRGKQWPRYFFPPGEDFDGGRKCLLHRNLSVYKFQSHVISDKPQPTVYQKENRDIS